MSNSPSATEKTGRYVLCCEDDFPAGFTMLHLKLSQLGQNIKIVRQKHKQKQPLFFFSFLNKLNANASLMKTQTAENLLCGASGDLIHMEKAPPNSNWFAD